MLVRAVAMVSASLADGSSRRGLGQDVIACLATGQSQAAGSGIQAGVPVAEGGRSAAGD